MQQACTRWRCTAPCAQACQGVQRDQRATGAQRNVLSHQAVAGICASATHHRKLSKVHRMVRACAEAEDSSRPLIVAVGTGAYTMLCSACHERTKLCCSVSKSMPACACAQLHVCGQLADRTGVLNTFCCSGLAGVAVVLALQLLDIDIEDALFGDGLSRDDFSLGNAASAVLWSTSLWFASPLQFLLLFLGKIDTERPSDWAMNGIGRLAGKPVDNLDYQHPAAVRAAALLGTVVAGCGAAFVLNVGLGDATWGVSSGIASCLAAGVYELGRPERLSVSKAQKLESQWQAFGAIGDCCTTFTVCLGLPCIYHCMESQIQHCTHRTICMVRNAAKMILLSACDVHVCACKHGMRCRGEAAGLCADRFAEQQLQKGGRCHENEIRNAFERSNPSYRAEGTRIAQKYLRDMVSNWHRGAQRTSGGFYKNVSLQPTTDPFTGSAQGTDLSSVGSTAEKS